MINDSPSILSQMDARSREVFRRVVEGYLDTGDPIGSRTLTRAMSERVSAATIRNVMQDLEFLGLLDHPHVSAGRIPTESGLRLFVDGLLEVGPLTEEDRAKIDATLGANDQTDDMFDRVGTALSGLTQGASLVLAPKHEAPIKHVEFVSLGHDRALTVLVYADGNVENRVFTPPPGQTPSSVREAANFLNALAGGRTLAESREAIGREIAARRQEIDTLASALVESGLAVWAGEGDQSERLIVRGRSNLLEDVKAAEDLERIRLLFDDLETQRELVSLLSRAETGDGVRIFVGSESKLFSLSGSSLVVSPYHDSDQRIVGALGVIGPTRLNYARVVPMVDYTAKLVSRLIG
jgi:heat-inducible transcriptional repressor